MARHSTGYDYVPDGGRNAVIGEGELKFAAAGLDHGHIYAMAAGLENAGAECALVWDPDPAKVSAFVAKFPNAKPAGSLGEILSDPSIRLVANAGIPARRFGVGEAALKAGKHFFVDKPPFTTLGQLESAR